MDKVKIYIVGAGGLGRDIRSLLIDSPVYKFAGFWDDDAGAHPEVKGSISELKSQHVPRNVVIGIGNPVVRRALFEELSAQHHLSFPKLVHGDAFLGDKSSIRIGRGTVVFPGAVLTTDIAIGENVIIHAGCSLHHDTIIGHHSVLMPGSRITGGGYLPEASLLKSGICITNKNNLPDATQVEINQPKGI